MKLPDKFQGGDLGLIIKFEVIYADGIALIYTHIFKPFEDSVFMEYAVEIHAGLIVGKIDAGDKLLHPFTLYCPYTIVVFDDKVVGGGGYGLGLDIVGLEHNDRGQDGELGGCLIDQFVYTPARGGGDFEKVIPKAAGLTLQLFNS